MLIGIDASKLAIDKKTGIDNAASQIILGLQKIDHKNSYFLYTSTPLDKRYLASPNFKERLIPFPKFWNKFRLPLALMRDKPDIFVELTYSIPPASPQKTIVMLPDFAFKYFPEAYSKYELMLQEAAISAAQKKARAVVVNLLADKNDFLKFYKFPEDRIHVIPLSYDQDTYKKISSPKVPLAKKCPYFLCVGRLEKRKNTATLIDAFALFKKDDKEKTKLILVGKNGYGHEEIEERISRYPEIKKDVIFAGYQSDYSVANLYAGAIAFVFPSLYEGFGIPALEAMASHAPVITSDISIMREVCEDAALYVKPDKAADIAAKMKMVAQDKKLAKELVSKGTKQIKKFSWMKTSEKFFELISSMS